MKLQNTADMVETPHRLSFLNTFEAEQLFLPPASGALGAILSQQRETGGAEAMWLHRSAARCLAENRNRTLMQAFVPDNVFDLTRSSIPWPKRLAPQTSCLDSHLTPSLPPISCASAPTPPPPPRTRVPGSESCCASASIGVPPPGLGQPAPLLQQPAGRARVSTPSERTKPSETARRVKRHVGAKKGAPRDHSAPPRFMLRQLCSVSAVAI
jgi:hypothetical protein